MKKIQVKNDALNVGLPKWPALIVAGEKVSEDLASEILIRTDSNLPDYEYVLNDTDYANQIMSLFGMPSRFRGAKRDDFMAHYDKVDAIRKKLGILGLDYLKNSRIGSSYIGGPHGWCDWSGNIFCNTYNIGKWPEADTVANEWAKIASVFPTLKLRCQLLDAEQCEDHGVPAVEYMVANGKVIVDKPKGQLLPVVNDITGNVMGIFNPSRERGIPINTLENKLKSLYGKIPQYND